MRDVTCEICQRSFELDDCFAVDEGDWDCETLFPEVLLVTPCNCDNRIVAEDAARDVPLTMSLPAPETVLYYFGREADRNETKRQIAAVMSQMEE